MDFKALGTVLLRVFAFLLILVGIAGTLLAVVMLLGHWSLYLAMAGVVIFFIKILYDEEVKNRRQQ